MKSTRLEAFSDGVIAIIITIMVLELKVPLDSKLESLLKLFPIFLSYVLSFILVAIYWVNHHHMIHLARKVDGPILWLNLNLLFWLSLTPFTAAYMGQLHAAPMTVAIYCTQQTTCAFAYYFLHAAIGRQHKGNERFQTLNARMVRKNRIALVILVASIPAAFLYVPLAIFLVMLPALMYFLPERRVEACEEEE
jgi:uncharacterized membrane protein